MVRNFDGGEYVLVFRPIRKSKLEYQWQDPYIISKKLTEVTYQVDLGTFGKRYRTFHVNCMRKWTSPTPAAFMALDEEDINHEKENTHIIQTSHHIELEKLKSQFKDILQDVPGRTTLVHHKIPTQDAPPIRLPPYRLAHHSKEFLRAEIQTLLKQGIIEPSSSPWAAPIVLVAKKDGSQHMCVDYRKLNAITIGDHYPLPRIEELINGIGASKFITTLDLTKGYYQVPVAPEDKEKTAFITPYGKYQFTTMPFGLVSAPSTFQRLMNEVLHGLHEFSVAYLDDILIHSATWTEHAHHLTQVFDRLRSAGLRVKERKCSFAKNKCVYLGYVVGVAQ